MYKVKIVVIGPSESGKTRVSNCVSEATEVSGGEYRPTQGVRILEFESSGEDKNTGKAFKAEVALWDCSGGLRFESCWPAFSKDISGVIIVYNPSKSKEEELEKWYTYFVKQQHLKDPQCLLLVNHQPKSPVSGTMVKSPMMTGVQCVNINVEEDPENVKDIFLSFLAEVCSSFKRTQEQDEQEAS